VTVELGTNRVVGTDPARIVAEAAEALAKDGQKEPPRVPPLWDGHAAERILDALVEHRGGESARG
jgi:UDP-N-acetylglucosamine 2-epimerase (non-hydrolysing)